MKLLLASLTFLLLTSVVVPATGQILYSNGLCQLSSGGCNANAWALFAPFSVSDNFTLSSNATMTGFDFVVWAGFSGDLLVSLDYSVTSAENGGTIYGAGTISPSLVKDQGINQYGYDIENYQASISGISLNAGTYWLNLSNALSSGGTLDMYWDENSGKSSASESAVGTIPSESFDILGRSSTGTGMTPEPSAILLFGSGVLGLSTVLRRKLF